MKHLYRIGLLFLGMFVLSNLSFGQVAIPDTNPVVIDFSGFEGAGFATSPSATQLDADDWATTGFSDGSKDFGVENTSGDHARGTSPSTTGGVYGVDRGSGNNALIMRYGGSDFTPGTLTLRIQNTTGSPITQLDISYNIVANNDQGRSISLNFAHSADNSAYTDVAALDYSSVEASDALGYVTEAKATTISGLNIAANDFYYLRWLGDDVSGSGSRDQLGLDDISITATTGAVSSNTQVQFTSASATVAEDGTSYDLTLGITNEDGSNATMVDVALTSGDAADINSYTTQTVTFAAGSATDETVTVTITDDATYEGDETLTFTLQSVSGGNSAELGSQTTFDLTITDNDPLPAETLPYSETFASDLSGVYTFSVSGATKVWEYSSGVAEMNGFNSGDVEEDWLILPVINMDNYSDEILSFDAEYNFGTDDANNFLKLVYSTDYTGFGDPTGATWTELSYTAPASSGSIETSGEVDVSAISGTAVYFALQYRYESGSYRGWEIDNIVIEENPILPEPTNHATTFAAVANGSATIDLSWMDNDGAQAAEGFLIKASSVSAGDITDPVDGTAEADGALVANVGSGVGTYAFSGLTAETQYFFKIYPYTNSGADIDYKTDGTVPEIDGTTEAIPVIFISEVADPSDDAGSRFVELYNPGANPANLSGFYLSRQSNGGSTWGDIALSGSIPAGGTFVIANNSPDYTTDYSVGEADLYDTDVSSNGDDAYFIYLGGDHTSGVLYDIYGAIDTDGTGEAWEFLDSRAVRNADVTAPNTTWTASEWTIDFPTTVSTADGRFDPEVHFACTPPSTQASALSFSAVGDNTITANWTRGDGDEVMVVVKAAGAVDEDPELGTSYTADAAFGSGTEIGTGNFVVYRGTGTSVVVTGLTQGTEYHFAVYEYGASNCYNTTELAGSESTSTPNDTNSDITALASPIAQADISSLVDSDVEAVDVFGFTLTDEGTDGQTTSVDGMEISAGTNNTADWSTTLAGAVLSDGTTDYPMTIAAGSLTLDLTGSEYVLANGTSQEFTLSVWFNTEVTDGDVLEFEIPTAHNFSALAGGSIFLTTLTGAVTSAQHTVDVTATALVLDFASVVGIATDFSLTATAEDANGNADIAARNVSISKTSGSGDLTGTGLSAQAMTNGTFTWSDLELSAADSYVLTVDDDGSALTATASISAETIETGAAQLLISEVVVTPTGSEYVEIYNNSGGTVALDDYYLTDATFAGGSAYYYNIVTGADFGGGGFADWHARFPAGAVITDGEVQTISLAGSEDFFTAYGIQPTYELYEDGSSADAIPDMREAAAGSINGQGGLTDGGEIVMLYYWDGASDLVTDIDYVMWGDQAEAIDKTGVSVDGPDADTDATAYLADLATGSQAIISASAHASGNSWQRSDFEEGAETKTGGNGVAGHNEMTEDFANTFIENTANPGEIIEPGSPLITIDTESFAGSFGFVELGQSSAASSYDVTGADLTADLVITPPVGFEIAAEMDFSGTIYTNSSAWSLTPTDGAVTQTVYVRFTPLAADVVYSGDIAHTSTDADPKNVGVSGTEGVFDTAPNIDGIVINEVLPDPNFSGTDGYDTDGSGGAETEDEFVEIYNNSGSPVDISGWQLWDESGMFFEFPAATTLGAGNYAGVMAAVQTGGTLPTPSSGNLAFEVGSGMSLSNGGENIALYNPTAGEYIQMKYGDGEADSDIGSNLSGATLNGIIEAWGGDTDGSSLVREPAGDLNIVVHQDIQGALAASFAEPTIDPNAPQITLDAAAFDANFGNVLVGQESATSTYTIAGTNLEADIVITAPDNFEISQDGTNFSSTINLTPTANEVSTTTITVKYAASAEGSQDGTITHTSTNALDNELDVAGAGITDATIFFEGFGSCDALNGFTAQSVIGDEVWECANFGETGTAVRMSGFNSGVQDNEDWLVTPAIDLSSVDGAQLSFDTDVQFPALDLEVFVSTDYTNDVTTANWTELDAVLDADEASGTWTNSDLIDLPVGGTVYVAFKYESNTTDGAASWTIDNLKVTETQPFFTVDSDGFNGDFGQQDVGTTSLSTSFTVEGFGLTADVTVTPPAQYEVSTTSDFASTGTSASPLTISVTGGTVDQEVFVRFAPATAGSFSGNVTVSTTGFDNVTLAVSGLGEEDDPTLSLDDQVEITVYPNPVQDAFRISNETRKSISVEVFALDGSKMSLAQRDDIYSIGSLNSGVYVLVVKDDEGNELARQQIIKE